MNRRQTIRHHHMIFSPKQEQEQGVSKELAYVAPMLGFILATYLALFLGWI